MDVQTHGKAQKAVELAHPLRVTLGQIVVHRHYVYTLAGQGVEEYGQRSHQRFTLTRGHLGNLTLVQYHTAKELYVVVDHIPLQVVATCQPVVLVDGLVALDGDKLLLGSQVAVELVGCYNHRLVLGKTAGRILHNGEGLRQNLVQHLLDLLVDELDGAVDLLRELLLLRKLGFGLFEDDLQLGNVLLVSGNEIGDALHQGRTATTQLIVRKGGD